MSRVSLVLISAQNNVAVDPLLPLSLSSLSLLTADFATHTCIPHPTAMKLLPVLIILGMASIDLVNADSMYSPPQVCKDLCKKAYPEQRGQCVDTCGLCLPGVSMGYLPKTLTAVPPNCPEVCKKKGKDESCVTQCSSYQSVCCHSVFGCCPNDARLCVEP
ncbi:hypothetical protein V8E36_008879 [Tilletia maclaganii]